MSQDVKEMSVDMLLTTLYSSQTSRRRLQKELDLMEEREKAFAGELIKRKITSAPGWNIEVKTVEEPFGNDWVQIVQYIKDTGEVDLLEKRLLKSGVKKRWEDGVSIPGVTKVEKTTIKVEAAS